MRKLTLDSNLLYHMRYTSTQQNVSLLAQVSILLHKQEHAFRRAFVHRISQTIRSSLSSLFAHIPHFPRYSHIFLTSSLFAHIPHFPRYSHIFLTFLVIRTYSSLPRYSHIFLIFLVIRTYSSFSSLFAHTPHFLRYSHIFLKTIIKVCKLLSHE
jgi:hypothetical protein